MMATLLLAMVAMVRGFSLTSPRHLGGLQRAQVVMNVGDEAMLQDAVKDVFDPEECKVDAETAEEVGLRFILQPVFWAILVSMCCACPLTVRFSGFDPPTFRSLQAAWRVRRQSPLTMLAPMYRRWRRCPAW